MEPIISSLAVQAGKQLINFLSPEKTQKPVNRVSQMDRFENRLEQSLNPQKADFESFLTANHVTGVSSLEILSDRLKQQLMQDTELREFLNSQPLNANFTLEATETGWALQSDTQAVYHLDDNGIAQAAAEKLGKIESILQMASLQPNADLGTLVDQAFDGSNVNVSLNQQISIVS